jgi:hypothetical protein
MGRRLVTKRGATTAEALLAVIPALGVLACGDVRVELITAPVSEGDQRSSSDDAGGSASTTSSSPGYTPADAGAYPLMSCETTADCTDEDLQLCHPTRLLCVECVTDGHCDEVGEQCSSVLGECATPCESDDDCWDDDPLCDEVIGYCVECRMDDDCLPGWLCRRSDCVKP